MNPETERNTLETLLAEVRRKIFTRNCITTAMNLSLVVLPITALIVAAEQRWSNGEMSFGICIGALAFIAAVAFVRSGINLARDVDAALEVDQNADLKDRISSAHEFLNGSSLDEARTTQIADAIAHAERLNTSGLIRISWPHYSRLVPVMMLAIGLAFLVPPVIEPQQADAAIDQVKQLQLAELKTLKLELFEEEEPELDDTIKKLEELERKFEEGELNERDVMLELGRMNEDLQKMADEMGVEKMEAELNTMIPHLMGGSATKNVAEALKEEQLDKAAEEMEKLGEKMEAEKLTPEQKKQMAMNFGLLAAKLGSKNANSFGGEFSLAKQSLEKSDSKSFCKACNKIGDKMKMLSKVKKMCKACKKIGMCKSCIGQCESDKISLGPKYFSLKKGGKGAGTAETGNPAGEKSRLEGSYKKMLKVTGIAGEGPVESEVEITDGQLSESARKMQKLHANFSAVAEEAIEDESIPLSHRHHVKRYFKSIKPQE